MLEMHAAMAKSDAKASKCEKMGLSFMETYPQEYQEYLAANRRFNELEEELERVEAIEVEPDEGGGGSPKCVEVSSLRVTEDVILQTF